MCRYSFGDARYPNPDSALLIEEITKQQMENIVIIDLNVEVPILPYTLAYKSASLTPWRHAKGEWTGK